MRRLLTAISHLLALHGVHPAFVDSPAAVPYAGVESMAIGISYSVDVFYMGDRLEQAANQKDLRILEFSGVESLRPWTASSFAWQTDLEGLVRRIDHLEKPV